ncbi:MAG: 3-oxoacyl-[acyl-carrier protein] reductase [uncultured Rubrobacteraceae bacterium]|uniref:3-oxoacyl-[acyl-carrier protein] reductase n=1 Tax=uncultured Rubrobacteraceae bacterium TaxID=349277 RepID=A0A6J4R1Y5_9ACTN|nr:MAG: 3-oxoacyl-[acyl-carrier protein] reductase [uncultured Rubrobacteraceae bacterium]
MGSERSRVTLVTGAGSGLGRAIAEKLAKDGESVVVNDLEEEAASEAVERIEEEGGRATAAPGDVSDPEDVRRLVESAREAYGPVEVLVSNAGFLQQQPFVDLTVEDFDRMISVHLRGTFLCIHAVLPEMLSAGRGVVVNIASQLGQIGAEGLAHYAAANAGIIGLTKSLAREVSAQGVRVNAVAPGPVNTPLVIDNLPEEWREDKAAELPLGRFGEPHEVAETVSFLASAAAALYVGQTLGPNSGDVML